MNCRDVMLTLVYQCTGDTPVATCARMMREEAIGFLPVVDALGGVVGVVTDRDLVVRVLADQKSPTTPVGDVMSPGPFVTCRPDEPLRSLEQRMANAKKSRALVQDKNGALLGIISLSDIAQVEPSAIRTGTLMREVARRESALVARP